MYVGDYKLITPSCDLLQNSPFASHVDSVAWGSSVALSVRDGLGLATIQARKGQAAEFAHRMREQLQIDPPSTPRRAAAGDVALMGIGPGAWLATHEHGGNAFAASLVRAFGDIASVADQSDGYGVLRLTGPKVRDVLCKLVPVDLHSRAFNVGLAAVTISAHIGVILWRLADDVRDGFPVFEVAVPRSFADGFWHAICMSAIEFDPALNCQETARQFGGGRRF